MSGLINAGPPDAGDAPTGSSDLKNPLLQQTENQIESKLTPENRGAYNKVVVAGLHIALDKGPNGYMAQLIKSPDPIGDCAKGAVALVLIMRKEAKGVMPMQAGIPAGVTLMLHGLDFIDHAGIVKIGENELARATTLFANQMFHKLGITPRMLQNASSKVSQIVQDPDAMSKINMKAGITQHPDAAKPTPIPGVNAPPS
jgi:hypothetical protein